MREPTAPSPIQMLEDALRTEVARLTAPPCPPRLAAAIDAAVFPGGARLRPRLCLAVAAATGDEAAAVPAAVALELLHCASLVHDDLPCFDAADVRRGRPSVHRAHGEALAVLAGDALIVGAFDVLARGAAQLPPARALALVSLLGQAVGPVRGLVAGQAWESEAHVDVAAYHQAKTGALFEASCAAGALAAGGDPDAVRPIGAALGRAYQILDDVLDATSTEAATGKSAGRDAALARPTALAERRPIDALGDAASLLEEAARVVPELPGRPALVRFLRGATAALLRRCEGLVSAVA